MSDAVPALLERFGPTLVALLEPMWQSQITALLGFMAGRKDRVCGAPSPAQCWRRNRQEGCLAAHGPEEMIPAVLAAARAVEAAAAPFLRADERDARAPFLLRTAAAAAAGSYDEGKDE